MPAKWHCAISRQVHALLCIVCIFEARASAAECIYALPSEPGDWNSHGEWNGNEVPSVHTTALVPRATVHLAQHAYVAQLRLGRGSSLALRTGAEFRVGAARVGACPRTLPPGPPRIVNVSCGNGGGSARLWQPPYSCNATLELPHGAAAGSDAVTEISTVLDGARLAPSRAAYAPTGAVQTITCTWVSPGALHTLHVFVASAAGASASSPPFAFSTPAAAPNFYSWGGSSGNVSRAPPLATVSVLATAAAMVVLSWPPPSPPWPYGAARMYYSVYMFVVLAGAPDAAVTSTQCVNGSVWNSSAIGAVSGSGADAYQGTVEGLLGAASDVDTVAALHRYGCWAQAAGMLHSAAALEIISDLQSGTLYYFAVAASGAADGTGYGPLSGPSAAVSPFASPPSPALADLPTLDQSQVAVAARAAVLYVLPFVTGGARITRYSISATPQAGALGASTPLTLEVTTPGALNSRGRFQVTLAGLTPATLYSGAIIASNNKGDSAPGLTFTLSTLPDAPAAPSISVTARTAGTIQLAWTTRTDNGAAVDTVRVVVCATAGACRNQSGSVLPTATAGSITLTLLHSVSVYMLTCLLHNSVSWGPASSPVHAQTTAGAPSQAQLTVNATGPLSLWVGVAPPEDYGDGSADGAGACVAFVIYHAINATGAAGSDGDACTRCGTWHVPGGAYATECAIEGEPAGLAPATQYGVAVLLGTSFLPLVDCVAALRAGSSQLSRPAAAYVTVTTPPNTPPRPLTALNVSNITATGASLAWTPDHRDFQWYIFAYTITITGVCGQEGVTPARINRTDITRSTGITVWGLLGGCKITARVAVQPGSGTQSTIQWNSAAPGAPATPHIVHATATSPTRATLHYTLDADTGGSAPTAPRTIYVQVCAATRTTPGQAHCVVIDANSTGSSTQGGAQNGTVEVHGLQATQLYDVSLVVQYGAAPPSPAATCRDCIATPTRTPPSAFTAFSYEPCACGGCVHLTLGLPDESGGAPLAAVCVAFDVSTSCTMAPFDACNTTSCTATLGYLVAAAAPYMLIMSPVSYAMGAPLVASLTLSMSDTTRACAPNSSSIRTANITATTADIALVPPAACGGLPYAAVLLHVLPPAPGRNSSSSGWPGAPTNMSLRGDSTTRSVYVHVRGLQPATVYTVRAALVNAHGPGELSATFTLRTAPASAPSCAQQLRVVPAPRGCATVQFVEGDDTGSGATRADAYAVQVAAAGAAAAGYDTAAVSCTPPALLAADGSSLQCFGATLCGGPVRTAAQFVVTVSTAACAVRASGVGGQAAPPAPPTWGAPSITRRAARVAWATPALDGAAADGGCVLSNFTLHAAADGTVLGTVSAAAAAACAYTQCALNISLPPAPAALLIILRSTNACGVYSEVSTSVASTPGCAAGSTEPPDPWEACVACAPGRYAPIAGGAACVASPPGAYVAGAGAIAPSPCPSGTAMPHAGAVACDACAAGSSAVAQGAVVCTACSAGTFALDGWTTCAACAAGALCVDGILYVPQGVWWRFDGAPQGDIAPISSDTMFSGCRVASRCIVGDARAASAAMNPALGVGSGAVAIRSRADAANLTFACATSTMGALCDVCAPGYAPLGGGCTACPAAGAASIVTVLAMLLVAVLLVVFLARRSASTRTASRSARETQLTLEAHGAGQTSLAETGAPRPLAKATFSILIRIFVDYAQALAATGTLLTRGAGTLGVLQNYASIVSGIGMDALPLACAHRLSFAGVFWLTLGAPPLLAIAVALTVLLRPTLLSRTTALRLYAVFVFLFYAALVRVSFEAFPCTPAPLLGHTYLLADMSLACDEMGPVRTVAAVALVVYVVGIPAAGFFTVWRARHRLDDPAFLVHLQFFVSGFKPATAWFEALVLLRKAASAAIAAFVKNAMTQLIAATAVSMFFMAAQLHARPFVVPAHNALETASLSAVLCTQMALLVTLTGTPSAALDGLVVTLNIGVVSALCVMLVVTARTERVHVLARAHCCRVLRHMRARCGGGGGGRGGALSVFSEARSTALPPQHPRDALFMHALRAQGITDVRVVAQNPLFRRQNDTRGGLV